MNNNKEATCNEDVFTEIEMTVEDFITFAAASRIVLRDSFNGRMYQNPKKHLDRKVIGFYPRIRSRDDSTSGFAVIEIVAWIKHEW